MKKVLFSSVCAVALLGINAYAEPTTVITSSLEDFLTQKKDLENKINVQNTLVTQKQESVNIANTAYQAKDKAYKDLSTAIITLTTQAGEKEGLKNKAELEHTNLVNQGIELNTQKENLNSEISTLNTQISSKTSEVEKLKKDQELAQATLIEKRNYYEKLNLEHTVEVEKHSKLVNDYNQAVQIHSELSKQLENATTDKDIIQAKVDEAWKKVQETNLAVKMSDDVIAPLADAKGKALYEYTVASENLDKIAKDSETSIKNLELLKSNLGLKEVDFKNYEIKIQSNVTAITQAKVKLDEALKAYNEALATVETTKQNQANAMKELDIASLALEQAKQELASATTALDTLKKELEDLQNSVTTEESINKAKEELGEFNLNNKDSEDLMILLAAANNDLSTASAEVKAEAKIIADKIATTIINEQKSEISSDVLSSLNVSINNMNKRLGEIRGLNEDLGVWFRAYGGRFSNDNSHFNYYSTQIGADKKTDFNNGDLIAGTLFGYDKVNSNAKSKGFNVGGYLSYISNDGYFADLVLKYIHTGYDKAGIKSQNSFLASVESGYRFNVYQNTYLEPSLELITGYVGKYEAKTNRTTISVDSYVPLIIKPQVFAGYSVNDFTFRAGVGAILDTKKHTANILISDIVKGINANASTKLDSNNRGFVSLGGSYKFNDNLRLNLSIERSFGSSLTNDYEINSTIRYTF